MWAGAFLTLPLLLPVLPLQLPLRQPHALWFWLLLQLLPFG